LSLSPTDLPGLIQDAHVLVVRGGSLRQLAAQGGEQQRLQGATSTQAVRTRTAGERGAGGTAEVEAEGTPVWRCCTARFAARCRSSTARKARARLQAPS
jgi:hypothetical protein